MFRQSDVRNITLSLCIDIIFGLVVAKILQARPFLDRGQYFSVQISEKNDIALSLFGNF